MGSRGKGRCPKCGGILKRDDMVADEDLARLRERKERQNAR